ncbi:MAG: 4Fe-4S ferredoxin [Gemmatimonadetes bacterium]|nr:4Fe-4S ferredoxin [Gemmatimonadota bacterium]
MTLSEGCSGAVPPATDPRGAALAAMVEVTVKGTGIVNYATAGRVLVVGPDDGAVALARQLPPPLVSTVVVLDAAPPRVTDLTVVAGERRLLSLTGHLGDFRVRLSPGGEPAVFDQVVDLCRPPLLDDAWRRFGYHVPADDAGAGALVAALLEQVGEFEKPRYFRYDPALCVRGRSGMIACNRCVQACPAGAITGLAERVEVDPYLCQGAGVCATVCPGGALQYAYPALDDAIHRLRRLLEAYRAAGGAAPEVLIHEAEAAPSLDGLPANVLPYAVEEVGSVGIELWLSALALGARAVRIAPSPRSTHGLNFALEVQFGDAGALLDGLGFPSGAIGWRDAPDQALMPPTRPATFAGMGSKREVLFLALDHLIAESPAAMPAEIELPATVPLGEVVVDPRRCTLCVACATVCPRGAISAEEGAPALVFFEARCVQCGLCERACPERAIRMRARLLTDRTARNRRRTLHEEPPFACISCGKPFATRSSLDRVLATLGKHPMFQDAAARRRLQMCADCRVADLMRPGGAN